MASPPLGLLAEAMDLKSVANRIFVSITIGVWTGPNCQKTPLKGLHSMESEQIKDLMGIHLVRYFVNKYMNKQKNYRDQTTKNTTAPQR